MQFIQGNNRHQTYFSTLEDRVSAGNPVRLIDAFIFALVGVTLSNLKHLSIPRCPRLVSDLRAPMLCAVFAV